MSAPTSAPTSAPGSGCTLPPHSVEAEQDVLGALLLGGEPTWDDVASLLAESDFYRDDHRRIFRTIRSLHESAKPVDVLTVADALDASNEKNQTGGLAYLGDLANSVASVGYARRRAVVIRDKALRRNLMAIGQEIERLAIGAESAGAATEQAQRMVLDADQSSARSSEPKHVAEVIGRAMGEIETRMDAGEVFGTATGFADLDRLTAGLHADDLVIVAGRPAMGKTAWALNVAENVAMAGKTVLVFSLEMGDTQLAMRSLASVGGASLSKVRCGGMDDHEWDAVTAAMSRLHQAKLYIDDAAGTNAGQMLAKARKLKRQHGLDLIVIDYLQLMQGEGNNRNEQLGDLTRRLKLMARSLNVPVICLSQISRKVEERTDKRPMMSDLRESGAIEQDADAILMVYRDDYYHPDSPYPGMAELLLVKNRMGETGMVPLVFQGQYSRFRDADYGEMARMRQAAAESKEAFKKPKKRGMEDF